MNSLEFRKLPAMSYGCAEAINTLFTNISFAGENIHKIMLTSSHADEGKSFVSMNLARTMANLGKKVVFVDADLRRSVIDTRYKTHYADPEHKFGIAHYLAGMVNAEEIVYQTNVPNLFIVPVGRKVSNSLALLVSPRFEKLLNELKENADYLIIDAPPIGPLIDGAEIAKSCDGILLVVNYNSVRRQELIKVKEQLEQTGCPILGTVLNEVEFNNYLSKKYYYSSYYYSRNHGYYDYYRTDSNTENKHARKSDK